VQVRTDWLIEAQAYKATCSTSANGREITLENGLIRRAFRLKPNASSVAFDNLITDQALLRAVKPEATLVIDGVDYMVGGLNGQPDLAYLRPEWLDNMKADPES
jgi:hypothetical protein